MFCQVAGHWTWPVNFLHHLALFLASSIITQYLLYPFNSSFALFFPFTSNTTFQSFPGISYPSFLMPIFLIHTRPCFICKLFIGFFRKFTLNFFGGRALIFVNSAWAIAMRDLISFLM